MRDYSSHSDQELIGLLKDGDERAFDGLYYRYWERMLHFAHQKTGNFMDAENVVQEVFVSLWNRREVLDIKSDFSHYLIVSIKYRIIRLLEKQRSLRIALEQDLSSIDILDDSTQQYLELEELKAQLEKHIGQLPEKAALIFRLSKEEGLTHKQIADQTGISERAVNDSLVKTKKSLMLSLRSYLNTYLL